MVSTSEGQRSFENSDNFILNFKQMLKSDHNIIESKS